MCSHKNLIAVSFIPFTQYYHYQTWQYLCGLADGKKNLLTFILYNIFDHHDQTKLFCFYAYISAFMFISFYCTICFAGYITVIFLFMHRNNIVLKTWIKCAVSIMGHYALIISKFICRIKSFWLLCVHRQLQGQVMREEY